MLHLSRLGLFVCAVAMNGCGGDDGGDTGNTGNDASTTAQTTGTSSPQTDTGTSSDPTDAQTGTTGTPTTGTTGTPTTESQTSSTTDDTSTSTSTGTSDTSTDPTADTSTGSAAPTASATLEPTSGSEASGTVLFTDNGGGTVDLVVTVSGVEPPGTHALHIHELPDCSAPDGNSTGNHWNPNGTTLGELGTIEIADDGTGVFMKSDAWSIGTGNDNDVVARSIIIHAESGGGTRIACGVIAQD